VKLEISANFAQKLLASRILVNKQINDVSGTFILKGENCMNEDRN
jgi:hypothetical protein